MQTPILQRGAVIGQFESSRHATQRPLAQIGADAGQPLASEHCTQRPRKQSGIAESLQSVGLRHSTHSPVAALQYGAAPVQL